MITRAFGGGGLGYGVAGWLNPPPLVTYTQGAEAAAWHPLPRPVLRPAPAPGQHVFRIPTVPFGDDPTNPAEQTVPRRATTGMVGRLHEKGAKGQ